MDSLSREFPGLSRIRQLLSSPTFPDDEEKTRVAYRLMMVSAASLISTVIYSLVWVIILPQFAGRLLLATVAMLLFGAVILCVQSGRVQTGRSLFLGGLWIVVTLASASSGGTRAPIYGVYALVIMSATILSGWNATIFYAGMSFIASVVMTHLSSMGLIREPFATPISSLLSQIYFMVLITAPIYIVVQDLQRALAKIRSYTSQLEHMVEERTDALRRANEQLELVLNNTVNALAFADSSGDIVVTNPAFHTIFSEQSAKSIESILWSLASEKHIAAVSDALLRAIYDHEIQHLETQFSSSDGRERDVDLTFIPVHLSHSDVRCGVLLSGHDITQLKEIERFKTRFVGDAVHDLATPITGISTRLYMLQRSPERMPEHVRALENQILHLRNLLNDLQTLSQIDRGHITLTLEVCNLNDLVQQVYDIFEPVALEKEQTLTLSVDPALPPVYLDRRQLERVLVNLVSNAINYTAEHKEIRIETKSAEQTVMVAVIDQGIGISAADLPHVFERFYRTDEARRNRSGGTGLGLAISKETVEMHGGTITATSEPGQGSTFTLRLPVKS